MKPFKLFFEKNFSLKNFIVGCICASMAAGFFACNDGEKEYANNEKENIQMIKEAPLPPGKQALEDEISLPSTTDSDPAMMGNADGGTGKTGLSKVNLSDPELMKKKFKSLLMFHADDTMEVNKPRLATLILSKDELLGRIKAEVLEQSNSTKEDATRMDTLVDLGSKMKARLISFGSTSNENAFNIEPLGDDIQSFKSDRKKIIWQWKITPLKPGMQELKLSIQIIEKDGEAVSLPARNIDVLIFAKPESYMTRAGNFFEKYWQFLITAILIPIITAWVSSMIKNKGPKPPKEPKQPINSGPAATPPPSQSHSTY